MSARYFSRVRFLVDILFTILHVHLVYMYVQYIQGLCHSTLGTAVHAVTHVAYVTTAA
jgi:hypothetical protein